MINLNKECKKWYINWKFWSRRNVINYNVWDWIILSKRHTSWVIKQKNFNITLKKIKRVEHRIMKISQHWRKRFLHFLMWSTRLEKLKIFTRKRHQRLIHCENRQKKCLHVINLCKCWKVCDDALFEAWQWRTFVVSWNWS